MLGNPRHLGGRYRGEFTFSRNYQAGDVVSDGDVLYIARDSVTGRDPSDTAGDSWELYDPVTGPAVTNTFAGFNPRLRKWYAALGGVESSVVSVPVIGDSFLEGTGATSIRTRVLAVIQNLLRRQFQPANVAGAEVCYIPAVHLTPVNDFPVSTTGTVTYTGLTGLGLRLGQVATNSTLTFSFTGTSAKLLTTTGPAGAKYTISIDGGAESAIIDAYSASVISGNVRNITGLTPGAHTVRISHDASSPAGRLVFVEGLLAFNGDESKGIRVLDSAHHGIQTSEFISAQGWIGSLRATSPHSLIIFSTGHNEATNNVPVATYKNNVQSVINMIRNSGQGNHSGAILLLFWPKRVSATNPTLWNSYYQALKEIESTDPDIYVMDLRARINDMPSPYNSPESLGLWTSDAHMTDSGQGVSAQAIVNALTPK